MGGLPLSKVSQKEGNVINSILGYEKCQYKKALCNANDFTKRQ